MMATRELINFFSNNPQYFQLIKECAHVKKLTNMSGGTAMGYPQTKAHHLIHEKIDS